MTKLSWAIVIFGIIIFITGITGVDFYKTFWGTIERGEGFLTIAHLITYFLLLTWTFKSRKEWLNYLTGVSIAGLLIANSYLTLFIVDAVISLMYFTIPQVQKVSFQETQKDEWILKRKERP